MKSFNHKNKSLLIIATGLLSVMSITGCKKLVEVDAPGNNLNAANVYSKDATAIAAVTGVYASMSSPQTDLTGNSMVAMTLFGGLSADELTLFNLNNVILLDYYRNNLSSTSSGINGATFLWNAAYDHIFTMNGAIEGLTASNSLTPAVKQHLLGEAKFIRAFCYFYLTNLYGDVPLILQTNWQNNTSASSTSQTDIYKQIVQDLKDAKDLLTDNYLGSNLIVSSAERIRPNKGAAEALLARTYLYTKDWPNADAEATAVIVTKPMYDTVSLTIGVFTKNSMETIWALQPVASGTSSNTGDGLIYILPTAGPNISNYPVYLSKNVVNSFETGDLRKKNWIDSVKPAGTAFYYPKKYKIGAVSTTTQEYEIVFRLAEMYLIRAEARAQQNNLSGAIADLDVIRKRSGLPLIANTNPGISQSALLTAILHERQVELFTEWGHRWLDLKRTNTIDNVMNLVTPQKGGSWSSYKALFPIPYSETQKDKNLIQNSGY
jgi:hypothetical protein